VREVARTLALDLVAADVVHALREAGVESVLLRGPAVARLYPPGTVRAYVDVDLLVPPGALGPAGEALLALGFERVAEDAELRGHRPAHAHEWLRLGDGAAVDLHRTLSGVGAPPAELWAAFARHVEIVLLGGVDVQLPSPAATALGIALHAAHHGPGRERSLRDLALALELVPEGTWRAAADLAGGLDALPAFGAGLSLLPAGADLAERLSIPSGMPVEVALRASGAPPLALGLDWLLSTPGPRAKAGLVLRTLFPAPGALRSWRALARRGRSGLVAAYASHPFWLARHALPSAIALFRARRGGA